MTYDQIIKELKNRIFKPIYFLHGDEPYYIDQITNYIAKNVLTEDEQSFNQTVLYGKDTLVEEIDNAARRFPMMATHQVIIVKEAQDLKKIENLVYYAQKPLKSTILVINYKYKKLAKNKKLYKAIDKHGVIFESKKLYDNQVPKWINDYLKSKKYSITPEGSQLLTEFLGTDLSKIVNEIEKLTITLEKGTKITPKHIEDNIGISKDYNNFELQNALRNKDAPKVFRIIDYFERNPKDNPLVVTLVSLFFFFSKILSYHFLKDKSRNNVASVLRINPYFVKDYEQAARKYSRGKVIQIISLLREYDLKSKGLGNMSATQGELLRELVIKIMH